MTIGAACSVSGSREISGVSPGRGSVPIYAVGFGAEGATEITEASRKGEWYPFKVLWLSDASYQGIALVRGDRLDALGRMRFTGRDQDMTASLRLTLDSWVAGGTPAGWREWNSYVWVREPGCYAFRVDGEAFSETIVIKVVK